MYRSILAALFVAALPVGASAGTQSWQDASAQTAVWALATAPLVTTEPKAAMMRMPATPDTGALPYIIGFVTVGPDQTGVPCFNCVNGAQTTFNIGLTAPYNYIESGEAALFTIALTNISNTSNCTLSWAITSGAKTIDHFSYILKAPQKQSSYVVGFDRNRPSFTGQALLTGKLDCGGKGAQTTTATLVDQ
jgi:hypothetical protein